MKTSTIVLLIWFLPAVLIAQPTFTVIKVNGRVLSTALKREVKTGDVITAKDKLTFNNKDAYLHVFNPTQGRKTLRNVTDSSPRELMVLLEKFAAKDKNRSKSRGTDLDYIETLSGKFLADTIAVLGNGVIPIDTSRLSLKEPAAIVAEFQIGDQRQKKTISSKNGFSLGKSDLFGNSSMASIPRISVWYYQNSADPVFSPSSAIGAFVPLYLDEAALKSEVNAIVTSLKGDGQQVTAHVLDFISQAYAPAVEENVTQWLKVNKMLQ